MVETEYNGHRIFYLEDANRWECRELSLDASTLTALKAKMQKIAAAGRKLDNVSVWFLTYSEVKLGVALSWADKDKVWIMVGNRRSKESRAGIVLDTPGTRAALAAATAAERQAAQLRQEASAIRAAIPRIEPPVTIIPEDE